MANLGEGKCECECVFSFCEMEDLPEDLIPLTPMVQVCPHHRMCRKHFMEMYRHFLKTQITENDAVAYDQMRCPKCLDTTLSDVLFAIAEVHHEITEETRNGAGAKREFTFNYFYRPEDILVESTESRSLVSPVPLVSFVDEQRIQ